MSPPSAPKSSTVVFVSHGRLRALDTKGVEQWKLLAGTRGVSVVLHNYPGYGGTAGPITEARLCADALQLVTFVMELEWARGRRLCLLGNSVGMFSVSREEMGDGHGLMETGCGPTMWLAAQQQLNAERVVLVSPYTSLSALASFPQSPRFPHQLTPYRPFWMLLYLEKYLHFSVPHPWKVWLGSASRLKWAQGASFDPFPPIALVQRLAKGTEMLLVHGEEDTTVHISHSYVTHPCHPTTLPPCNLATQANTGYRHSTQPSKPSPRWRVHCV